MKKTLTKKQKIVLKAIKSFIARRGISPSIRELQQEMAEHGLSVRSTRSVFRYLEAIEQAGFIRRCSKRKGIEIVSEIPSFVDIPVYGHANAGVPNLLAEQNLEGYLKVSKNLVWGKNVFAVQVFGTSMNQCKIDGKNIDDGDYVIVDYDKFEEGDKVLAVVDGLATVKTLQKIDDNTLALLPESSDRSHQPILITPEDDLIINGRVITVLKNPHKNINH